MKGKTEMIKRISDKRREKGEKLAWNSTIKAKPYTLKRTPIRKVSQKAKSLWDKCREEVFSIYGRKCLLCGSEEEIHVHHYEETRVQNPARKYDITNLVPLCGKHHNHTGADERFYKLRELIKNKLKELNHE